MFPTDGREGKFHDQGEAIWIVIRGQLRGHNHTPFGRPTPGQPPALWAANPRPQGVFSDLSYYQLVILFFNIVPLIMEFTGMIDFESERRESSE
jgi:hypothetical protein